MRNSSHHESGLLRWLGTSLRRLAGLLRGRPAAHAVPGQVSVPAGSEQPGPESAPAAEIGGPGTTAVDALAPRADPRTVPPAAAPDMAEPEAQPEAQPETQPETQPGLPPEAEVEADLEREAEREPAPEATPESAVLTVPDPEVELLLGKIAEVEGMLADLTARQAEMQQLVHDFQVAQYRVLGDSLAELLSLRHEYARALAASSGLEGDAEKARRAAEQREAFSETLDEAAQARPELDTDSRDELKRLYRSIAMRCHPDRVAETDKAAAHERFQRAQRAYRDRDTGALHALLRELDAQLTATPGAAHAAAPGAAALKRTLSAMRGSAADLILAIQTLQLDDDYRRAQRRDEWDEYFESARSGFEIECEALRRAIEALQA